MRKAKKTLEQKHPHERGEDIPDIVRRKLFKETPPRAWGRRPPMSSIWALSRNTPTSVGKTSADYAEQAAYEKHPHVGKT